MMTLEIIPADVAESQEMSPVERRETSLAESQETNPVEKREMNLAESQETILLEKPEMNPAEKEASVYLRPEVLAVVKKRTYKKDGLWIREGVLRYAKRLLDESIDRC